jgi:hypothetical protein
MAIAAMIRPIQAMRFAAVALLGVVTAQAEPAMAPEVHFGRLIDVYVPAPGESGPAARRLPYRRDVLVGTAPSLLDGPGCRLLPADPESGRTRVMIDAEPGSAAFVVAWERLVGSAEVLTDSVPRDAALRLRWSSGVPAGAETAACIELVALPAKVLLPVHRGPDALWFDGRETVSGEAPPLGLPADQLQLRCGSALPARLFTVGGLLPAVDPLRILAELPTCLARATRFDADTWILTLECGGIRQALDAGDMLRLHDPANGQSLAVLEVEVDVPTPGGSGPVRMHVPVRCDAGSSGEAALVKLAPLADAERGPKVVAVVPFDAAAGDDPANFVRVASQEVVDTDANGRDVAPRADYEVLFSAPVELSTLARMWLEVAATEQEVPTTIYARDASHRRFYAKSPLGLRLDPAMRQQILADQRASPPRRQPLFRLVARDGAEGVRSLAGEALVAPFSFGITLDPAAPDNLVQHRSWSLR